MGSGPVPASNLIREILAIILALKNQGHLDKGFEAILECIVRSKLTWAL